MRGMASRWLVVSLCRASLNIIVRSWLNSAIVATITVAALTANVAWVLVMCGDLVSHKFFTI